MILIGCYETHAKNKLYDILNLKLSVLSNGLSILICDFSSLELWFTFLWF
jgi:hypothetical protein